MGKAIQTNELPESVNKYNKEKRLFEYVNENPFYVIREILRPGHRSFITYIIHDWLLIALSVEDPSYEDSDHRQSLITFQDHLLSFIEALFIILIQRTEEGEFKEKLRGQYQISLLTNDQKADPSIVIIEFFNKYSMAYIHRELEDWQDAAINYHGPWREDLASAWHVLDTYRNVSCLIKAANRLLTLNMIPLK